MTPCPTIYDGLLCTGVPLVMSENESHIANGAGDDESTVQQQKDEGNPNRLRSGR